MITAMDINTDDMLRDVAGFFADNPLTLLIVVIVLVCLVRFR